MADEVSPSSSSFERDPIEKLADSFIVRFRAGERPSIEEYALKYPELAGEIRELLPALVELELNQSPGGTVTGTLDRPVPSWPCGNWAITSSSARSAGAGWASSTRPCSSRSAATWR
jgi:hypothetical protein